jgi:hypothetical protein
VKNILSSEALKTIYYSVFHCHLIYAIQLWSCTNSTFLTEIVRKQKQAIRLICGAKYNSHTEPLFKKTGILPFVQLADFFKMQFMQQCYQDLLPPKIQLNWIKNSARRQADGEDLRLYHTRNFDDFFIPFSRLTSVDKLPLMVFPRLWNTFPNGDIKMIRNRSDFKLKLKLYLLTGLSDVVTCNCLLCQACHPIT